MSTVQIKVHACQARNIAAQALIRARNGGRVPAAVSDPCVVREVLALAREQGVNVQFMAENKAGRWDPVDLAGVKKVLEGRAEE